MHPFSTPWRNFQGVKKGYNGNEKVNISIIIFSYSQKGKQD